MPAPELTESNVRHLLRRTEFVDRPDRVAELLGLASMADAVNNVMDVPEIPQQVVFGAGSENWERGTELTHFWFNQMAHDSPKPLQEKMAFFWHGHFCTEFGKVDLAELMREQIDLWRTDGMGNIRDLAKTMSLQVAMIRYLDNNENSADAANQNFARELMELFLLGVGNYSEADVEASTSAWTGHTDHWESDTYWWRDEWHDGSDKTFLGQTINQNKSDRPGHGPETIDVMLSTGIVPNDAIEVANRGRLTRDVAAEFLSFKLWTEFATDTQPPPDVRDAMRDALVANDFDIRPWLSVMLNHEGFYTDEVKAGLVRPPVEYVVAMLCAIGVQSEEPNVLWKMNMMGQRPFFPPNVSGWKPNGYWINASSMEGRAYTAQSFRWVSGRTYWQTDGVLSFAGGDISRAEITANTYDPGTQTYIPDLSNVDLLDQMLDLMRISLPAATRDEILEFADASSVWERVDMLLLILLSPEMNMA